MKMKPIIEMFNLAEASEQLKMSKQKIRKLCNDGEMEYIDTNATGGKWKQYRFTAEMLIAFIEKRKRNASPRKRGIFKR